MSGSFDPMDCNLLGSSVHRISQARILEWIATILQLKKKIRQGEVLSVLWQRVKRQMRGSMLEIQEDCSSGQGR